MKILPYLKLMRISALPTCWSNVLTAFWLGGAGVCDIRLNGGLLGLLLLTSSLFYLGGMVFNDACDAELDAKERPERPIPKGEISKRFAEIFGNAMLFGGLFMSWFVVGSYTLSGGNFLHLSAFRVAVTGTLLFLCVYEYDLRFKRIPIVGAITMGLCRFLNILMVSFAVGGGVSVYAVSVFVYITAITILSGYEAKSLFVRKLVGIGLSSIILIDAVWCLVFVGWIPALVVLALYPVAMGLRRIVSMT